MRMTLQPDLAELAPGDEVEFHVVMANDGTDPVEVELDLQGLDADLWALGNPIPVIDAGQIGRATIRVRMPDDATPGERRISVSIRDASGSVGASAGAALRVGSNDVVAIETDPASVAGRSGARLDTIVRNRGDDTIRLRVSGRSDGATVEIRPSEFDLPAGKGARLKARITPTSRAWFREKRHGVVLDARGGTIPATASAIYVQKPTVPPVLLRAVAVLLALAVWAGASLVLFQRMSSTPQEAATDVVTDVIDGDAVPPDVLLAGDLPSDEGAIEPPVVVAGTIDGPRDLAGTTVLIERVSFGDEGTTDGSTGKVAALTPVALTSGTVLDKVETVTDDAGRFRVASGLVIGAFYRVTASRSGFDLRSEVVRTSEDATEIELAMSLVPGRGSMTGRVVDTAGNPIGGAQVVATQGTLTYRTTTTSTGDAIGTWTIDGLATPFTYLITVATPGFSSQQLTVDVDGGASRTGVDAEMMRDRGTIRGRITYRDSGVGAVTVSLSGEVARTTTTLTTGDLTGSFDFPNLPYGTYLLTFTAPGWLESSREVIVAEGDVPVDVADLLPSTAVIQGVVAQQVEAGGCDYPDPTAAVGAVDIGSCGGVGVTVTGENGTWSTTTATGDGSFRLSGIPAGEYTVEFDRYGYLPEFYRAVVGAGDVLTLPDDATYDVEMAAYVGPRNRVLEPLDAESVQMRLVPTTPLDAAEVTGTVRDVTALDTGFDQLVDSEGTPYFDDWSLGCRDERVDVTVIGQPDVVCLLEAGGGFSLTGVAPGAADVVVNAPGFGTYTSTIQVAPDGTTQMGLIALTPLASLVLNVTGTGDVPIADATVFVAPSADDVPLFKGAAAIRDCTVTRADTSDIWQERSTVPTGHVSRTGLCADADSAGDISFARGLGTGSFNVILPVNGSDPSDPATLAGPVPLDHRQLTRAIEVQVGESARLDLRLRRYASIVGTIQVPNASGTGYTNLGNIEGLESADGLNDGFPYRFTEDADGNMRGVQFCEIYAADDDIPAGKAAGDCRDYDPSFVTPRFSFGSAAGLSSGSFRIDRIPPNEGAVLREYLIRISTDEGDFERSASSASGGIEGLAFGEDRTLSVVASPTPTSITINAVWDDGSPTLQPVPGALVRVTGTAGYRTIDVAPFREEVVLTCPSTDCADGGESDDGFDYSLSPARSTDVTEGTFADLDDPGTGADENSLVIDGVYRLGTLTVEGVAPGFDYVSTTSLLSLSKTADGGFNLELLPSAKPVDGSVSFSPTDPTDAQIADLTVTLTPVGGGSSLSTALEPGDSGGATYSFSSVRPGSYTLQISGAGVFTTSVERNIVPSSSASATLPSVTVNRTVALEVRVNECAPGDTCSSAPDYTTVTGATVRLRSSIDGGGTWTLVSSAVTCADENVDGCDGNLGIATFSNLIAEAGTIYKVEVPVLPKSGYRRVTTESVVGSLSLDVTEETVEVEQFASITGVIRGKVVATDSDSAAARLAGVTVQLKDAAGTVITSTSTDGSGAFTFAATTRIPDGDYVVVVPRTGAAASYEDHVASTPAGAFDSSFDAYFDAETFSVAGPAVTDLGSTAVVLVASEVAVAGTVVDPTEVDGNGDPVTLANVRVSVVGATCPTPDGVSSNDECVWTDANGEFSLQIAPRTTTLKFEEFDPATWTATYRPVVERSVSPSVGQGISGLQLEMRPALGDLGGTVSVRNYDGATTADADGATVTATSSTDISISYTDTTAADGSFSLTGLLTGSYDVTVQLSGYETGSYSGVLVVANGSALVPEIKLNADSRTVRVKATSGAAALGELVVVATPPSGSSGLTTVSATTNIDGEADLDLVPGTWTLKSTNGATGTLTADGVATSRHIDATGVALTVPFDSGSALLDLSASPSLTFVEVTGTVNGEDFSGSATGVLEGAAVTYAAGAANDSTDASGAWSIFAPSGAGLVSFTVSKIGYTSSSTSATVATTSVVATASTVRALPGTAVTVVLTSTDGTPVLGATATVTQDGASLSEGDDDNDGTIEFPSLSEGEYELTIDNTNGVVDGASNHLAFGPVNPVSGDDRGLGPRTISVASGMGDIGVVLQKLDRNVTGTIGTSDDGSLTALVGATVTATSTAAGQTATISTTLTGSSTISGLAVATDRPWVVTVSPPADGTHDSYVPASRSVTPGASTALGRVTLSSGERTVSGTLTGPAGRTVTVVATANGYAERTITDTIEIDTDTVEYELAGLSVDVTWRIEFSVAGVTVTRWVGPGASDVTMNQSVGADAVAAIRVVVVDTAEVAARTDDLTVAIALVESTSAGASTTTTLPLGESVEDGSLSSTLTLVSGQTSDSHTFANLVKFDADTNGLLEGRFTVTVTPSDGYSVDGAASAPLISLDPENQTLLVQLDPDTRSVATTLFDSKGTTSTGDDSALGNRAVTLTRTIAGQVNTITGTADGSTTNLYTFSGVAPGTWSLSTDGFSTVPVLVPVETGSPASTFDVGTVRLLSSTDRLDASRVTVSDTSVAVLSTTTVTVQLADGNGNLATSGGQVRLFTDHGSISTVIDNNNGTYSATYSAAASVDTATITASLDGRMLSDTATVTVVAGSADAGESSITLSRASLPADGSSAGTITIRLADTHGNSIRTGGETVLFTEGSAALALNGSVTDHGNGTYSQAYTAGRTVGTAVISATVGGSAAGSVSVATTQVTDQVLYSTLTAASDSLTAGGSATTITVQLKSAVSTTVDESAGTVAIWSTGGTMGAVADNGDGTYTASYSPPTTAGDYVIWASLDGLALSSIETVSVSAGAARASTSTVTTDRYSIPADGSSTGTVTITLRDQHGNVLGAGATAESVGVSVTGGGVLSATTATQQANGTYAVTYTAAGAVRTSVVTASLNPSTSPTTIGSLTISNTPVTAIGEYSTISASSATSSAGGSDLTISLQLKDGAGAGDTTTSSGEVALFASGGSIAISSDTVSNDGALTAAWTPPTTPGTITVWATVDGVALSSSASVPVVAGPASASTSTVSADRFVVPANGSSTSIVTVVLRDQYGNPLSPTADSETVGFSASGGGSVTSTGTKAASGYYTGTFTAPATPGTSVVTATVGGAPLGAVTVTSTQVTARLEHSTVTASSSTFIAGGSDIEITVQLKSGASTSLGASGGRVALFSSAGSMGVVTDNSDGSYSADLNPPNTRGEVTVWATLDGLAIDDVATVTITPGAAIASASIVSVDRNALPADRASTATVTATLNDAHGNRLNAGGATVAMAVAGGGSVSSVTDNSDGTYTATLTSAASIGTSVVSVTVGGSAAGSVSVLRTRVSEVTTTSTISASAATTTAGGASLNLTVQLKDSGGNITSNVGDVVIRSSAGSVGATSFSAGTYSATLTAPTAVGTVLVWAMIDGVALADSVTVTVNPGTFSSGASIVSAASSSLSADGSSTSMVTVTLRDTYSNELSGSGGTVTMEVASGSGSIGSVTDNSDGTYSATYTAGSVAGVARIEASVGATRLNDVALITLATGMATEADTTLSVSSSTFTADGSSTITVTVQPRDSNGNAVTTGSHTLLVTASAGTLANSGTPTRQANGAYTVALTSPTTTGVITVTATLGGSTIGSSASVTAVADSASSSTSMVSSADGSLTPDGSSTTTVTIRLRDTNSNPLTYSGGTVTASVLGSAGGAASGTLGSVTDNGDGTYSVTYTAGVTAGTDIISASVGGNTISDTASVTLVAAVPYGPTWTGTSSSSGSVALSWDAPSANGSTISDYVVEYRESSVATWTVFADGMSALTGATVTGLVDGTPYRFRIAAVNGLGTGPYSTEVEATPSA